MIEKKKGKNYVHKMKGGTTIKKVRPAEIAMMLSDSREANFKSTRIVIARPPKKGFNV